MAWVGHEFAAEAITAVDRRRPKVSPEARPSLDAAEAHRLLRLRLRIARCGTHWLEVLGYRSCQLTNV